MTSAFVNRSMALLCVAVLAAEACSEPGPAATGAAPVGGPLAALLRSSTDLGPASEVNAGMVVSLRRRDRPQELLSWAGRHGLRVDWFPGDDWAMIHGAAPTLAQAFAVAVHDYRGPDGRHKLRIARITSSAPKDDNEQSAMTNNGPVVRHRR